MYIMGGITIFGVLLRLENGIEGGKSVRVIFEFLFCFLGGVWGKERIFFSKPTPVKSLRPFACD